MQTMWKYKLKFEDEQELLVPKGAYFMECAMQNNDICLWALVDTDREKVKKKIKIYGTGYPITYWDGFTYLGMFQLPAANFVGHVFVEQG